MILVLSLGLRLGGFIKGVFKDLFPGERVDGGRPVHLVCRLGQGHPQIPRPACAEVFLGKARIVLTQLGDLPALFVDRHPPAFCPGGLAFPFENVRHEDFRAVA